MRPRPDKFKAVVDFVMYQDQVLTDMAVTMIAPISYQGMVVIAMG